MERVITNVTITRLRRDGTVLTFILTGKQQQHLDLVWMDRQETYSVASYELPKPKCYFLQYKVVDRL